MIAAKQTIINEVMVFQLKNTLTSYSKFFFEKYINFIYSADH